MSAKSLFRTKYKKEDGSPLTGPTERWESLHDTEQFLIPLAEVEASSRFTPGVVEGLEVRATLGERKLQVSTGVALDADGRLIVLAKGGWVSKRGTTYPMEGEVSIEIENEMLTSSKTYVLQIEWFESPDKVDNLDVLLHAPRLSLAAEASASAVPLALVKVEDGRVAGLTHQQAWQGGRSLSGLRASRIDLYAPVSTESSVTSERQGGIGILPDGGIEFSFKHSSLSILIPEKTSEFEPAIVSLRVPKGDTLEFAVGSSAENTGLSVSDAVVRSKSTLQAPRVRVWDGGVQLFDTKSGRAWIINRDDTGRLVISLERDGKRTPKVEFSAQGIRLHGDVEIIGNLSVHGMLEYETARKL